MIASPASFLISWFFRVEIGVVEAGWNYPRPEPKGQGLEDPQLISIIGIGGKRGFSAEK